MNPEKQNFNPESTNTEEKEPAKSEKEIIWENKKREIEQSTDFLGYKIDNQVKETVVAFNLLGLPTNASCEGHLDHGTSYPWIEVAASDEPEEQFVDENKVYQKIADKYGIPFEDVKRGLNNDAWVEAVKESSKNSEATEYQQWREKNKKLAEKASKLLEEFYQDKKADHSFSLEVSDKEGGSFRVENVGEEINNGSILRDLTDEQKKTLAEKLPQYQQEMKRFTKFLRDKYFNSESSNADEKEPAKSEKEIQPELIKDIERSKFEIDDKMNILLTKGGLKPASEINLIIKREYKGETTEFADEKEINEAISIIKGLDLPFRLGQREVVEEGYEYENEPGVRKFYPQEQVKILIGRTEKDLGFLIQALEKKSDELLGRAFGFPKTAIEAFLGKRPKLDVSSLPKEIRESDAILFSSPTLSEANWQEEIKQGQKEAAFIKEISPVIYEELREISLNRDDIVKD